MFQSEGYIFDLDGTLLDSMQMWLDIDTRFLIANGIQPTDDYSQAIKTMGYQQGASYTVERFNLNLTADEVIHQWEKMAQHEYAHHIKLKKGALDYLLYLRNCGHKLSIATALTMSNIQSVLNNIGIYDFFDNITTLSEVLKNKDHPDIYLLAAKRMQLAPEDCTVYEDLLPGIRAAKGAGFKVCGVYDGASSHQWDDIVNSSDMSIKCWHELLA